jgi:hypothetical protein
MAWGRGIPEKFTGGDILHRLEGKINWDYRLTVRGRLGSIGVRL